MREIQASDAKARLPSLLDEVERGETIVITRHGTPIVPEADFRRANVKRAFAAIKEFRKTLPSISLEDILSGRHEGHKY